MFFKKKKPEAPPEQEHQAIAPEHSSLGQSKFAPGLNVNSGQIDFGLGSFSNDAGSASVSVPSTASFDPWLKPEGIAPMEEVAPWSPPEPAAVSVPVVDAEMPPMAPDIVSSPVSPLQESWQVPPMPQDIPVGPPVPPIENLSTPPQPVNLSTDLSPEQAWAMMEPGQSSMQPVSDETPEFALSNEMAPFAPQDFTAPNTVEPTVPFSPQENWAIADESSQGFALPVVDPLAVPFTDAVPPMAHDLSLSPIAPEVDTTTSWATGFEEFGAEIPITQTPVDPLSPDFGLSSASSGSFEPYTEPAWMNSPAQQDVAFESSTETSTSSTASWELPVQPFESLSFEPTGTTHVSEPSAYSASEGFETYTAPTQESSGWGLPMEPVSQPQADFGFPGAGEAVSSTSLDALWESSTVESEADLHSRFQSGAQESGLPAWEISEPHLGIPETAPDLMPPPQPIASPEQGVPAFDPMQASQELAAGWPQVESAVAPESFERSASYGSLEPAAPAWADESLSPLDAGADWALMPGAPPEPVYFHETAASPEAETQLWTNLSMPESAPGEQVPYTSGAMMDAINEQLYPEDPFSSLSDNFSDGEQAFAEAARYLFPETVSAPLEWEDGSEDSDSGFYGDDEEDVGVINLGPSYSTGTDSFAELPGMDSAPASTYHAYQPPEPEAFSGVSHQQQAPYQPSAAWELPIEPVTSFEMPEMNGELSDFSISTAPVIEQLETYTPEAAWAMPPQVEEPMPPSNMASQPVSYETPLSAGSAVSEPLIWSPDTVSSPATSSAAKPEALNYIPPAQDDIHPMNGWDSSPLNPIENDFGAINPEDSSDWATFESMSAPYNPEQVAISPTEEPIGPVNLTEVPSNYAPMEPAQGLRDLHMPADSGFEQPVWSPPTMEAPFSVADSFNAQPQPSAEKGLPEAGSVTGSALEEEYDFYATAFTLNERGELVPVHEEEMFSGLEAMNVSQGAPTYDPPVTAQSIIHSETPQPEASFSSWDESQNLSAELPVSHQDVSASVAADLMMGGASVIATTTAGLSGTMPHAGPLPPLPVEPLAAVSPPQMPSVEPALPPVKPAFSPEQFLAASRKRFVPPAAPQPMVQPNQATSAVAQQQMPPAPYPVQPMPQPQASMPQVQPGPGSIVPPVESPAEPEAPKTIRPKPLTFKAPVIPPAEPAPQPLPAAMSQLESQWYTPEQPAVAPQPSLSSTNVMEMKLTLGNLEVMGLCQLSTEKRLLVVHNEGVYALMGQTGQDASSVNVLKVFEHNPLAYQHTFTAVEEGKAAGQGMYVIQVGTWHAIISTFQDKISLHTELG